MTSWPKNDQSESFLDSLYWKQGNLKLFTCKPVQKSFMGVELNWKDGSKKASLVK